MSEWKEYRFSDFAKISPQVALKAGAICSFVEMADLKDGNKFCEPVQVRPFNGSGTRFQERDTLFARITPCLENGKICQVRNLLNNKGFGSTEFHVFRGREGLSDTDFVYYLSRSSDVRDFAEANFHGTSGRQRVPRESFDNLFLNLPDYDEQRAIADVLSSLDDKIDLLHRQNKTLEGMAEALWRKMFVDDADPNWEKGKLGDYVQTIDNRGKTPPFSETETDFPIIEVNALTGNDRLINYSVIKKYVTENIYHNWFRAGHPQKYDTLIATVGSIGEIAMFLNNKGSIAQNIVAFRAIRTSPFYLYQYLKYLEDDVKEYDIGSVQPSIKVTHLIKMDFIQPDEKKLNEFDKIMEDITNKLMSNQGQVQILSCLRDTLLPKLMSGEVRVNV